MHCTEFNTTVGPSTWLTDGGDGELRTSVYPSNIAPIATKLRQRAFRTICNFRFFDVEKNNSEKKSDLFFGFSLFLADFRRARLFLTSKSSSSRNFASDGQISRSVRHLEPIFQVRPLAKYSGSQVLGPTVGLLLIYSAVSWQKVCIQCLMKKWVYNSRIHLDRLS